MANRTGANSADMWGNTAKDGSGTDYQIVVDSEGRLITSGGGSTYDVLIRENSGDSNLIYIGKAAKGSATSSAVWQIKRLDKTTKLDVNWADSDDNFDNVWDNRESLSY